MFDRKRFKKQAKEMLKKHYALLMIACLIAALVGSSYVYSLSAGTYTSAINEAMDVVDAGETYIAFPSIGDALHRLFGLDLSGMVQYNEAGELTQIGALELGRRKGIFSSLVNRISNARFISLAIQTIHSLIVTKSFILDFNIILASMIVMGVLAFVKHFYSIAYRRIFLESYQYDITKSSRFLFLFRSKKWLKACTTMFVVNVYQFLWNFTIIGGIIARYNYMFIPYIVAENPGIDRTEAIRLSRRMVFGHRFELFKMRATFLPWMVLGRFTLGATDVLFTNPYLEATTCQYYFALRNMAKIYGVSYADNLGDDYLARKASYKQIEKTYADVIEMMTNDLDVRDLQHDGLRGFVEDHLGIIYRNDRDQELYNAAIEETDVIDDYHQILNLRQYPDRLSPYYSGNDQEGDQVHYLRRYSLTSIILMFFGFSFVGWIWEVLLHIVNDGRFVNRGVMHGPWLPIYGSGAVLILVMLFRYRRKPILEAALTILLCGTVEYFGSWYLEVTRGMKWWDYSGYFINLNGRICAEGLTVFMIGGLAAVYVLAPILDNKFKKIIRPLKIAICIVLTLIFAYDMYYSHDHPNTGKGITDYDEVSYRVDDRGRQ